MDHELDETLHELLQRLVRLEVEEPEQVDEREREREPERQHRRARQPAVEVGPAHRQEARDEEDREDVGEADRPGDLPVHLLEGDREERREEEEGGRRDSSVIAATSLEERDVLLVARPAREPPLPVVGERGRRSAALRASRLPGGSSALRDPVDVLGRDDDARARSRGSARRRHRRAERAARIGRSAARYSKTLPESTPLPRPAASGMSSSSASESRWSCSDLAAGRVREQLEPVAEAARARPTRGRRSGSRRRSAPRRPRPDSASAVRNGRGSRLPKKLPVCVMRKRSPRRYVEPVEVVEVGAVRDRGHRAPRVEGPASPRRSRPRRRRSRRPVARRAAPRAPSRPLLRAHEPALDPAVRVRDERVAQVGDPADAGRALCDRRRRGGRRPAATSSARRRSPRALTSRIAARFAVRFHVTFSSGTSSRRPSARGVDERRAEARRRRAGPPRACARSVRGSGRDGRSPSVGSARRPGAIQRGSSGVSTCVSTPSSGR